MVQEIRSRHVLTSEVHRIQLSECEYELPESNQDIAWILWYTSDMAALFRVCCGGDHTKYAAVETIEKEDRPAEGRQMPRWRAHRCMQVIKSHFLLLDVGIPWLEDRPAGNKGDPEVWIQEVNILYT